MSDINRAHLSGRLTRDPELRTTPGGTSVMNARLAFSTGRKVDGQWTEESNFVDLVAWGKSAEFYAGKLSQGSLVFVEGRLKFSEWDSSDGTGKRSKLEIVVDEIKSTDLFNSNGGGSRSTTGHGASDFPAATDDDIPF